MVQDAKERLPHDPVCGEGWGGALLYADHPSTTVTEEYEPECLGCHIPAEPTDWIYVQGYPLLKKP